MRTIIATLLAWSGAMAAEQFTLQDGRVLVGDYDAEQGTLTTQVAGMRASMPVRPEQIVKRAPVEAPATTAKAPGPRGREEPKREDQLLVIIGSLTKDLEDAERRARRGLTKQERNVFGRESTLDEDLVRRKQESDADFDSKVRDKANKEAADLRNQIYAAKRELAEIRRKEEDDRRGLEQRNQAAEEHERQRQAIEAERRQREAFFERRFKIPYLPPAGPGIKVQNLPEYFIGHWKEVRISADQPDMTIDRGFWIKQRFMIDNDREILYRTVSCIEGAPVPTYRITLTEQDEIILRDTGQGLIAYTRGNETSLYAVFTYNR